MTTEVELEHADLLAGLDVLAGLAACFAAMDDRPSYVPGKTLRPTRWRRPVRLADEAA